MKRFIIGRLGVLALAGFFAGCAVASTSQDQGDESVADDGSSVVETEEDARVGGGSEAFAGVTHSMTTRPSSSNCAGCGPHPEPWQMGPHPEPWIEPNPSSSSGGSSSGGSRGNGNGGNGNGGNAGNGKPN
jgi:hypothetical protein